MRQWNRAAEAYWQEEQSSRNAQINRETVERRFSNLPGWAVLDVGCGCGGYTDYFRRAGANATGCDGAPAMLALARRRFPECTYHLTDLLEKLPYESGQFDLVFCNQVLMDLPELQGIFREFSRVLKEGGILYFSIVHPAGYPGEWVENSQGVRIAKKIRNYGKEYKMAHDFCGGTTHFHRPISVYLNLAAENNFRLVRVEEPVAGEGDERAGMPLFLFAEFRKDRGE